MLHYKHGTRLRLRQPCLQRYASLFITKFYVGRYLAPLPFQSGAVFVVLRILVHYEIFCRQLFYTTSLPESGLNSCICALTSSFLNATILRCFPSRVGPCLKKERAFGRREGRLNALWVEGEGWR